MGTKHTAGTDKHKKKPKKSKKKEDKLVTVPLTFPRFTHDPSTPIQLYYEIRNKSLGEGTFSQVKEGIYNETQTPVAIKIINKEVGSVLIKPEMLLNEVRILKRMENPYIIKLFDIFETDRELYLVMELVTGGPLFERIAEREQYSECNAKEVMRQLCTAIEYFHSLGVVHRDLKPENLLLISGSDTNIKVTDFGLSRIFDDLNASDHQMMTTVCGSLGYVAPEILNSSGYDKEVDMWSAGVILYVLLSGYPPFWSEHEYELCEIILHAEYFFHSPYWDGISPEAKNLIEDLLVIDPKKRLTATEVLQHNWFKIDSSHTPMSPVMREKLKAHNTKRKENIIEAINQIKLLSK